LNPRFQENAMRKNLEIVKGIEQVATEKGCTPAQLALAWVLAQGEDLVPIPGTKKRTYLDQNLDSLQVRLSPADLKRLDEIAPPGITAGTRYPEAHMHAVGI
jgi:aryl-alcohol dehydrogenase-like predicted oxidoreductase